MREPDPIIATDDAIADPDAVRAGQEAIAFDRSMPLPPWAEPEANDG